MTTQTQSGWIGLELGILEEFETAAVFALEERTDLRESYRAMKLEDDRAKDRERKARQRAEALAAIREAEGIAERMCPVCGVMFPVELGTPGRPRVYCSDQCQIFDRVRRWRDRAGLCACGCGRPVRSCARGRPRLFATIMCRVRAWRKSRP